MIKLLTEREVLLSLSDVGDEPRDDHGRWTIETINDETSGGLAGTVHGVYNPTQSEIHGLCNIDHRVNKASDYQGAVRYLAAKGRIVAWPAYQATHDQLDGHRAMRTYGHTGNSDSGVIKQIDGQLVLFPWNSSKAKIEKLCKRYADRIAYGESANLSEGNPNHDAKGEFTTGSNTGHKRHGDIEPRLLTEREVLAALSDGGNPNHDERGRFTFLKDRFAAMTERAIVLKKMSQDISLTDKFRARLRGELNTLIVQAVDAGHKTILAEVDKAAKRGWPTGDADDEPEDSVESHIDQDIFKYPTTDNPSLGGYLRPEGDFIDMSGGSGQRAEDHRSAGGTAGMQEMTAEGYIRWMPEGNSLDIAKEPTASQYRTIRELAEKCNGEMPVELSPGLGEWDEHDEYYLNHPKRKYTEYPVGTHPDKIVQNIRNYYGARKFEQYKKDSGGHLNMSESSGNPNHDAQGRFATGHSATGILPHIASPEAADAVLGHSPAIVHVIPTTTQTATKLEHIEHRFYTALDGPPGLSATDRAAYQASFAHPEANRQAISEALAHMQPAMLDKIDKNLGRVNWFPDLHTLQIAADKFVPGVLQDNVLIEGFCNNPVGSDKVDIYLDGPGYIGDNYERTSSARETYAHELGHVIDGPELTYSSSDEWIDAANIDIIKHHMLTSYACESAQEAFAETIRAVNTKGVAACKVRLPHCMNVLQDKGLV